MLIPGRHEASGSYRYGFNGKEKDDEIKGQGVQYDYGFRVYDVRLGKFLSIDPLYRSFAYYTPYQFAANSPIANVDLDGLEQADYRIIKCNEDGSAVVEVSVNQEVNFKSNNGKLLVHNLDTGEDNFIFEYEELNTFFNTEQEKNPNIFSYIGISGHHKTTSHKGYYTFGISNKKIEQYKTDGVLTGITPDLSNSNPGIAFTSATFLVNDEVNQPEEPQKPKIDAEPVSNNADIIVNTGGNIGNIRILPNANTVVPSNIAFGNWSYTATDGVIDPGSYTATTALPLTQQNLNIINNIANVLNANPNLRLRIDFPAFNGIQSNNITQMETQFNQSKFNSLARQLINRGVNASQLQWGTFGTNGTQQQNDRLNFIPTQNNNEN